MIERNEKEKEKILRSNVSKKKKNDWERKKELKYDGINKEKKKKDKIKK